MMLERVIYWTPRVLGLLFALFISLFALDVFGTGQGFWETILAFVIHLIPVWILLIGLALAWRWDWVGTLIFGGFAVWYTAISWGPFPLMANLIGVLPLAGPPLILGLLFLLSWRIRTHTQVAA